VKEVQLSEVQLNEVASDLLSTGAHVVLCTKTFQRHLPLRFRGWRAILVFFFGILHYMELCLAVILDTMNYPVDVAVDLCTGYHVMHKQLLLINI
jgi:hypothetical protein